MVESAWLKALGFNLQPVEKYIPFKVLVFQIVNLRPYSVTALESLVSAVGGPIAAAAALAAAALALTLPAALAHVRLRAAVGSPPPDKNFHFSLLGGACLTLKKTRGFFIEFRTWVYEKMGNIYPGGRPYATERVMRRAAAHRSYRRVGSTTRGYISIFSYTHFRNSVETLKPSSFSF